ncbi:MAG: acyl-CoA dehydrogenase family protein [Deltaproteobacteria bacterium]|nr:acyl-CoA dehydrogenase family protein [Deltaproteobacteria bacterium]
MDFGFTEKQEKLRKAAREFFLNEMPEDFDPDVETMFSLTKEQTAFWMKFQKKAGKKGYLTPGWSKETGGLGYGPIEQGIVEEEWGFTGGRWPNASGLHIAGPAVQVFGTEEQKKKFLPGIAQGTAIWNQAFTEPDAGSDEANQKTTAVLKGNYYVLNGQKTFITTLIKPDYLYTLARTAETEPKHQGISLFLVPADAPGITYQAQGTMGFGTQLNIYYKNVKVPKENLLGELNRGFYHAMAAFEFERSGTGNPANAKRRLTEFIQFCKKTKRNGKPLIKDTDVRKTVAKMAIDIEIQRLIAWEAVWRHSQKGQLPPKGYDLSGFFNKINSTQHPETMMHIMGLYGQLRSGAKWAKFAGKIERRWQVARSVHPAGTLEVNKIVVAGRGLGLPRIPARFNKMIAESLQPKKK